MRRSHAVAAGVLLAINLAGTQAKQPPHIIFIMADDLGESAKNCGARAPTLLAEALYAVWYAAGHAIEDNVRRLSVFVADSRPRRMCQ